MKNINKIKKIIVEKLKPLKPDKIIIFGSYAYGKPDINSDIDICVVKNFKNKLKEKRKIREALRSINFPKDILLINNDFLESHKGEEWINTVWYNLNKFGEIIYEKKSDKK